MVVIAAVRTRLGVAARPDALVEGGDRRTIACSVPWQHPPQGRRGERAFGQGVVQAAPAAAVCRLQAPVRERGNRISRQEGIDQLEQSVGSAGKAPVEVGAEGAESSEVLSGHNAQLARTTVGRPASPTAAPSRVKSQAWTPDGKESPPPDSQKFITFNTFELRHLASGRSAQDSPPASARSPSRLAITME